MNTSKRAFLLATGAAAVLGLGACASDSPTQRSTGEFTDDAATTAKVKTAIATDAGAKTAAAVNVETYRGVVQLTGFVDTEEQSRRAVEAAKKVAGVRSVKNDLRVK
jgi:hyperosmotically inducible periplasmic protein